MLPRLASYLRVSAGIVALLANSAAWSQQLPTGGSVAAGSATIAQPNASTLDINQSTNQAIINWNSFSVGQGGTVNFNQPNSSSATLNRVLGSTPSSIAGMINAPGTVLLVNPNGIAITKSGVIKTNSFAASTLDIKDADFLAGNYKFTGNGGSAAVTNAGRINVSDGGFAALLGGQVANSGVISARLGKVGLGAGELITLDFAGDGFLSVAVPSTHLGNLVDVNGALVTNSGKIRADGGQVFLTAATASNILRDAVNVPGSIRANTVGTREGKIVIGGGTGGKVNVTGKLAAKSKNGKGGDVVVTGKDIALKGATVDASGKTGGGSINVGGGRQGQGPLQHAESVTIDSASVMRADALNAGNGGSVVVWSDGLTSVAGTLSALGANGGLGGFIETSGHTLSIAGAHVSAGPGGQWLLDPYDLTVDAAAATAINFSLNDSGGTDVTLQTTAGGSSGPGVPNPAGLGDITVANALSWNTTATLTLDAYRGININASITITGGGKLALNAAYDTTTVAGKSLLQLYTARGASVSFAETSQGSGVGIAGQALTINGDSYNLIYSLAGIQSLTTAAGRRDALALSLTATGTYGGYVYDNIYRGTFEGLGNTIADLKINSSGGAAVFRSIESTGTLRNFGVVGASVFNNSAGYTGSLVGQNYGIVANVFSSATLNSDTSTGGLVGANYGAGALIVNAYFTGSVNTDTGGGGITGTNEGTVSRSFSSGAIRATSGSAGGLVGTNSFSSGKGLIIDSYATGRVTATTGNGGGGLAAYVDAGAQIVNSYWDVETTGRTISDRDSKVSVATYGLTTANFQNGGATGLAPIFGGGTGGLYPYLKTFFPNGVQTITGTVYSDAGVTAAPSGLGGAVTVTGLVDGNNIGSVTAGANGYYYMFAPAGTISGSGSQLVAYSNGVTGGATQQQNATGSLSGFNIYGTYLKQQTTGNTLSNVSNSLATALGANALATYANRQIDITASSFAIDQSISVSGTLNLLSANGGITQTAGGISAAVLNVTTPNQSVTLNQSGNNVASIGGINVGGGAFALTTAAVGSFTVTGGAITANGGIAVTNMAGSITTIGGVAASNGAVALAATASGASITLGGAVSGVGVTLTSDAALTLNNNINGGAGTVSLNVTGAGNAITQAAGAIIAGTLTLATNSGNATLGMATNAITNLGTTTLGTGVLNLADSGGLTVTGAVTAGNVQVLSTGTIAINNTITASGVAGSYIWLTASGAGNITQSATGGLAAVRLQLDATAGSVNAIAGAANNNVTTLAGRSDGGFAYADANTTAMVIGTVATSGIVSTNGSISVTATRSGAQMQVARDVTASNGNVTLLANSNLFIGANVAGAGNGAITANGTTGVITLASTNSVVAELTGGSLAGARLAASAGYYVDLRASNTIGSFAASAGGVVVLFNSTGFTVDQIGTVSGITAGGDVVLRATNATGTGDITQTSLGTITTSNNGTLLVSAASGLINLDAANAVAGNFAAAATGNITLRNTGNLNVGTAGISGLITDSGISAINNTLTLNSNTGTVTQGSDAGDRIIAGTVQGRTTDRDMMLTNGGNQFGSVGPTTLGTGALTLVDSAGGLTVTGAVSAGGGVSLQTPGALSIENTLNGGTGTVSLTTTDGNADITQNATGVITAGALALSTINGNATLNTATNLAAGLGPVTLGTGALNLLNGVDLTLTGAVTANGGVVISNTGFIATAAGGTITSNAEIALTASTDVTIGDTVTSNGGVIALTTGAGGTLTVNAQVDAGAGNVFLTADNMTIAAPVRNTGSANIATVTAGRGITLGDAPVPAGLVIDNASGELNSFIGMTSFNVGKNRSGTTTAGAIQLGNGVIATNAVNLFTTAGVSLVGSSAFIGATGAGTLTVTAVDTVNLGLGVAAGTITGSVSGAGQHFIAYGGGSNINVGAITTNGGEIAVGNNNGTLAVVGDLVSNGGHINAFSTGVLTLSADLDARGATDGSIGLRSNAGINQTAGGLFGKDLLAFLCSNACGSSVGSIALDSATNAINGNVTLVNLRGGNINFANSSDYTVGGISSISYATAALIGAFDVAPYTAGLGGPGIRTSGTGTVTLTAGGDINQANGVDDIISTDTLIVSAMTGFNPTVALNNFNTVANLGAITLGTGAFVFFNDGNLTITGAATAGGGYSVETTGDLIQSAAAIIDTSSAGGPISLIAGCGCTGGNLTLNADLNAGPAGTVYLEAGDDLIQVAGTITGADIFMAAGRHLTLNSNVNAGSAGTIELDVGDNLTQAAGTITAANVFLGAGGDLTQVAGAITADTVNVDAATVSLNSPANNFAVINGQSVVGDFAATTSRSLTVGFFGVASLSGSVSLTTLGAGSDIVVDDGAIFGNVVSLTAGQDIRVVGCGCGGIGGTDNVLFAAGRDILVDNVVFAGTKATLVAGRDLTLESNAVISSLGSGDAIVLSTARNFINNAGASVLDTSGGSGRWLIYSSNPASITSGGLDSGNAPIWSTSYPTPIAASGNRYVYAGADPSPPSSNNNPSQFGPPNTNPTNPGVNIAFQNPAGGPINVSFTPAPRTASNNSGTDVSPASLPDGAALATNNGMTFLPISMYDANQYSQFALPNYVDQASLSAVFTMIARGVDAQRAPNYLIDTFWDGTAGAWKAGDPNLGTKVTFSDGLGNAVAPTGQAGFPIVAGSTDFVQLLKTGPVMISGGGNPASWLLATQMTADGKGIVANDPSTGKQVVLSYDAATKTVGGVTGVFDASSKKFVSFADAGTSTPALTALQSFVPATFLAVTAK